tara:strand:- start:73 stop:240 length:168 start_codon:yes stop_codon:yes gene_type:complete
MKQKTIVEQDKEEKIWQALEEVAMKRWKEMQVNPNVMRTEEDLKEVLRSMGVKVD